MSTAFSENVSIPARVAAWCVRLYQLTLSPFMRTLRPGTGCRFQPSCSQYAREALLTHGFWSGIWLTARRLVKCHPLCVGGFDPVPDARAFMPGRVRMPHVES